MLKTSPSAVVVPFAIMGNDRLQGSGFPSVGEKLTYSILDPIERQGRTAEEITNLCEEAIKRVYVQQ